MSLSPSLPPGNTYQHQRACLYGTLQLPAFGIEAMAACEDLLQMASRLSGPTIVLSKCVHVRGSPEDCDYCISLS